MAINSHRIRKPIVIVVIVTCLIVFGVLSTSPRTGLGEVDRTIDNLKTSSEENLVDKVFTFLASEDTLRFDDFYLYEKINYYILLEIVTPHNCEINVTIIDPVLDVYEVFKTEVNISQGDDWFEIPFGTAIEGNYSFIISVACAFTLNLHVKISFDTEDKCLYDIIAPKFLERMKLYQVNKFTDGMVVEHNTAFKTDTSYKFYLGRVSAIGGLTVSMQTDFFLITGRNENTKNLIIPYLQLKGYRFTKHYFNQMSSTSELDESTFMIMYWTAKAKLINQLKLSNDYKSVVVIDDDKILSSMLEKLGIEVYRAEITKDILTQTLSIAFHHPQKLLMSELQAILKPHQEQREQIADTV